MGEQEHKAIPPPVLCADVVHTFEPLSIGVDGFQSRRCADVEKQRLQPLTPVFAVLVLVRADVAYVFCMLSVYARSAMRLGTCAHVCRGDKGMQRLHRLVISTLIEGIDCVFKRLQS